MVNRGPSNGCTTCKRRRVKCDEGKPYCHACQRLGLVCGGYKKYTRLKFKDQNHKFIGPAGVNVPVLNRDYLSSQIGGGVGLLAAGALQLQLRAQPEPDTSVPFFLLHYAAMGRDLGSARGFFEVLIPVYVAQRPGSALSMAVEAVAKEVLGLWLCGHGNFANTLQSHSPGGTKAEPDPYAQAVRCLRRTIQDPEERGRPATVMAVLTLQLYENLAAVYGLRAASSVHHDGALSLLPFVDLKSEPDSNSSSCTVGGNSADAMASEYIRRFILHTEVSSAMRQQRPIREAASSYSSSASSSPRVVLGWGGLSMLSAPDNPSSTLDAIGASVAEFQARYCQLVAQKGSFMLASSREILMDYRTEAKHLDEQLLAWAQAVPEHWQPVKVDRKQGIDPSITTYRSFCAVYPYCQIGTIWNLWRIQRLLLVKIILSALSLTMTLHVVPGGDEIELLPKEESPRSSQPTNEETEDFITYIHAFQDTVDSICDSIPFFLGNRVSPSVMADFTDPSILLPLYPKQFPAAPAPPGGSRNWSSAEDHKRHVIAQGPWHVMSPLSRLLTLFTEDNHGKLLATFLRPGQHQWIREQFLRVTMLIRVRNPYAPAGGDIKRSSKSGATVEDLARGVRKGAVFMSGP
ncbi:hypothetical protein BDV19DRAFT_358390 [Aspergillus venezuelensis]